MKVIDLLNKIANGEEVPSKIKFDNKEYEDEPCYMLYEATGDRSELQFKKFLNDEVEILEEEKKIPEKLPDIRFENGKFYLPINDKQMYILREIDKVFLDKFNEIIDYLKSKGDE